VAAPKLELKYVAKAISPCYPSNGERKARLKEDLTVIGCEKLLDLYWGYKNDEMLKEIVSRTLANQFKGMIRAAPHLCNESEVAAALLIQGRGQGFLQGTSWNIAQEYFDCIPNRSDGWKYMDYTNEDLQDILYFLIPLTNPHKPSLVTVRVVEP
jgi:hypothetical protein